MKKDKITAQLLLKKFKKIKTLPHIAIQLTKLISHESTTIHEIEEIILLDPTLVARLLRLINSSYYGLIQKVDKIATAVVYLGLDTLRNIIVVEALKDIFMMNKNDDKVFSRNKLWFHCAVVSICSQMISERIFGQNGENAFLCGILHDIGMIVEEQVVNDLFIQVCKLDIPNYQQFIEYENTIIGTDHCKVGHLLSQSWKLPFEVYKGIKNHHKTTKNISPSSVTGIVQLSEYLSTRLGYGAIPKMVGAISPSLRKHIYDNIIEYKILLRDLPIEISKAKEIYQISKE